MAQVGPPDNYGGALVSAEQRETDARIIIDELLRHAGWDPADKSQVQTERTVKIPHRVAESDLPYEEDEVRVGRGQADYVLLDARGRPLAVIEAKRGGIDPYTAKKQTLPYARQLQAPFIFLSNGELIYFWDYEQEDARLINSFYSRRDLERLVVMRQGQKPLAAVPIPEHYSRRGQIREVRRYQQDCMRALDHALSLGKRRFLIHLPTGTGKTDLIVLYLRRLFQAHRAERVLFLVDRDQLAKQAIEAFQDILSSQHGSYWLRAGGSREEQQITVCLLQTMINRYREFTSGYFDVVIADECHRSIYGAWQTALTHFDAIHVGLTATPCEYIERNTYRFYGCDESRPDFSYDIRDAFQDGFLAPYKFNTAITRIIHDGADTDEEHFDPWDFERRFTNEDTNRKMMREFYEQAVEVCKEIAPKQNPAPGKTVIFAITKRHAARLARYLNEIHQEKTGDTSGEFAAVITSDISDADDVIRRFKRETMPQVAVSVGMLDTGFDCPEVLHIVMCRFVRSPILYQQMRGRGTRRADHIGKKMFIIYDFFGNHEYFNDSDTDVFVSSGGGHAPGGGGTPPGPPPPAELIELGIDDEWLFRSRWVEVGEDGERIDKKEYITNWEETIRAKAGDHPIVSKIRAQSERGEGISLSPEEEAALAEELNSPKMYFNEENLRQAYRQPTGGIVDFIKYALGLARAKSPEERINENFQAWLVAQKLAPEQAQFLSLIKNRFIANGRASIEDLFRPPLSLLNAANMGIQLFGEKRLKEIIEDLNMTVFKKKVA